MESTLHKSLRRNETKKAACFAVLAAMFLSGRAFAQQEPTDKVKNEDGPRTVRFPATVNAVALSETTLGIVGESPFLQLWSLSNLQAEPKEIRMHAVRGSTLCLTPTGMLVGGNAGKGYSVFMRYKWSGEVRAGEYVDKSGVNNALLYSKKADRILMATPKLRIGYDHDFVNDPQNRSAESKFKLFPAYTAVQAAAVSPDGMQFAVAQGNQVDILDTDGVIQRSIQVEAPRCMAFLRDGVMAIAAAGGVTLFDKDGTRAGVLGTGPGSLKLISSKDGRLAVATDKGVLIWDAAGLLVTTLRSGPVSSLAFSPEGTYLAASSGNEVTVYRF